MSKTEQDPQDHQPLATIVVSDDGTSAFVAVDGNHRHSAILAAAHRMGESE